MKNRFFTLLYALVAMVTTANAQENMIDGHEYVDLGLPSGTLWATCNVGASKPEEYGDYFAWGETKPKDDYSWETYKWGTSDALTNYTGSYASVLVLEDDAANTNWGGDWHMPTIEDVRELFTQTFSSYVELNGVKGYKFTAKKDRSNSIFLPDLSYWSSSLNYMENTAQAFCMFFKSDGKYYGPSSRCIGMSIRPVIIKNQTTGGVLLNAENFPDANFRKFLVSELKINEGGEISEEKIAETKTFSIYDTPIADLTGIEYFTALTRMWCDKNSQLTSLDVSKNTALITLWCYSNQLTSLNVSKNTVLTTLWCDGNQLTSLDVSQNIALGDLRCDNNLLTKLDLSKNTDLTWLECNNNQLSTLDLSQNTALHRLQCNDNQLASLDISQLILLDYLYCNNNQLTSLKVSKNNTALWHLYCYGNQIKGEAMDALVNGLPTVEKGYFYVINTKDENEGNVCTKVQVTVARNKGWTVYDYNDNNRQEYEGSDPVAEDIDPVDEDDNIDFGSDMDENDDLNGNVIGDIYYNINTGDGGYDAAEGCIVVKKPTDDGTVGELEGKDIFGEDFKSQFTGIVFKVPAGKGTIKVNAETTGNMLLKVKIGSNDPVEMELNGKLKVTFPYNVSETTYVYIYAGAANEAKGFGAPASGDAALKIYGIEFIRDNTPTDINSVDSGELTVDSWYTIDGKKLAGEPKEKGIYIRNGRKVVK